MSLKNVGNLWKHCKHKEEDLLWNYNFLSENDLSASASVDAQKPDFL